MNSIRSRKPSRFARKPVDEVVEHADAVAAADERFGDVRADEAGPAGHKELRMATRSW